MTERRSTDFWALSNSLPPKLYIKLPTHISLLPILGLVALNSRFIYSWPSHLMISQQLFYESWLDAKYLVSSNWHTLMLLYRKLCRVFVLNISSLCKVCISSVATVRELKLKISAMPERPIKANLPDCSKVSVKWWLVGVWTLMVLIEFVLKIWSFVVFLASLAKSMSPSLTSYFLSICCVDLSSDWFKRRWLTL